MHAFVIVILPVLLFDYEALFLKKLYFEILHDFNVFFRVTFWILLGISLVIKLHWLTALELDIALISDLSEDHFEFFYVILDSFLHA